MIDPTDKETPELLETPFEAAGIEPSFSFTTVHDRVFVTWFEHRQGKDDFQFVSDPMAIELTAEEAAEFNDFWNKQMDDTQAMLQGIVENRKGDGLPDCDDPDRLIGDEYNQV